MSWIQFIASGLMGGGIVGGLAQLFSVRNEARRASREEKELHFREPLFAMEAAERSVAMMKTALDKADADIRALEATIAKLQLELQQMRDKYVALQNSMAEIVNTRNNVTGEGT